MKRTFLPRQHAAGLLVGTALLFTACASAPSAQTVSPSSTQAAAPAGTLNSSDYVYVMVPGSNVPVLMLKSRAVTNYPGVAASDVSYLSPVAFHELINRLSGGSR